MVSTRLMRGSIILLLALTLTSVFPPSVNATRAQSKSTSPLIILKYGDLWAWDTITTQVRQLTHHGAVNQPVLSPDRKYVAYQVMPQNTGYTDSNLVSSFDLWLLDLATGKTTQITSQPSTLQNEDCIDCPPSDVQAVQDVIWSPDSQTLYWHSNHVQTRITDSGPEILSTNALWMLNITSGKQAQITTTLKDNASRTGLAVSPDSKKLAWIKVTRPTAEQYKAYENGSIGDISTLFQLVIHDLTTGKQILTEIPGSYGDMGGFASIDMLWEADGIGLSYLGPESGQMILIFDTQGNKLFSLGDPADTAQEAENSDNGSIVLPQDSGVFGWYTDESNEYFAVGPNRFDIATKTIKKILPSADTDEIEPTITIESYSHSAPDGYAVSGASIVDSSGKTVYELPSNRLHWAIDPTGQYIAYSDTSRTISVWDAKTGNVTVLNFITPDDEPPLGSPEDDDALLWSQLDQRLRPVKQ